MAQEFKEVACIRTDMKKYAENYEKIFNKHKDFNVICGNAKCTEKSSTKHKIYGMYYCSYDCMKDIE